MRNCGSLSYDKIELYAPEIIRNGFGEQTTVFNKVYECRTNVMEPTGDRKVEDGQILNTVDLVFQVRYYVPVTDNMQVHFNGAKFKINFIDKRRSYMDQLIKCTKITE